MTSNQFNELQNAIPCDNSNDEDVFYSFFERPTNKENESPVQKIGNSNSTASSDQMHYAQPQHANNQLENGKRVYNYTYNNYEEYLAKKQNNPSDNFYQQPEIERRVFYQF